MIQTKSIEASLKRIVLSGTVMMFSLLSCQYIVAQDLVYSQFYNAPLQLNPAFAGNSTAAIVAANYRNQWPGIGQPFTSYSVSFDQFYPTINSGLGFYLQSDNTGDGILKTVSASAVYSYQTYISRDVKIKFGLEGRFAQNRLDWDQLIFGEQINVPGGSVPGSIFIENTETRPDQLTKNIFDISAGFLLYTDQYYAGVNFKHINNPNISFLGATQNNQLPMLISFHAGTQINFEQGNKGKAGAFLLPNLLVVRQSNLAQINVGTLAGIRNAFGGVWYRHGISIPDAVIFSVGLRKENVKITYSYDFTVSKLAIGNTLGSHEIGLVIKFRDPNDQGSRYNDCLSIFR